MPEKPTCEQLERLAAELEQDRAPGEPASTAPGPAGGAAIATEGSWSADRAEAELRNLARFPEENPNPVLRVSVDGTVLYCNPSAAGHPAWRCEVGRLLPHEALRNLLARALAAGRFIEQDVELCGTHFAVGAAPLPAEGYVNLYGRDITSSRHAEEALRQSREDLDRAQEVGQIGWWRLDTRRNVLTWSDESYRIFGVPRGAPLTYEAFLGCVHPDDRDTVNARWEAGLRGEPYDIEHRIVADGRVRWVREKAYLEFDSAGQLLGGFGITQDITDRRRAEEALREANEQLENKVQQRTAELAQRAMQLRALARELTLSEQRERRRMAKLLHDHLQQLLVGAKFRLTVLGRHEDPVVQQATQEVEKLIDDAIIASRSLTAELYPPALHEGGLGPGLEWLARWMADKHGLIVELSMDADIPPPGEEVKVLLFESVRELLFNAVKHARAGSAAVNVRGVEGRELRITVSDTGSGFDPTALRQAGLSGGGFGLFSVRERLDLIGGRMEIDSAPGRGSRVMLTAPLSAGSAAAPAAAAVSPPPVMGEQAVHARSLSGELATEPLGSELAVESPRPGAPIRVLLADDHVVMREGLARLLAQEPDIEIVGQAANGAEAVMQAARLLPDVILMDMSMPKLNGVEATRAIRNEFRDIRIIGLSMFQEPDRARALIDAGAVDYLSKSGPPQALIAAIRACMAGPDRPPGQDLTPAGPRTRRPRNKT